MSRIWAVARQMMAESIRLKVGVVFIGVILITLTVLPFTVAGDGVTLQSRIQSFLSYSLGIVGTSLSLLTVFLSCGALSHEIRDKYIIMIASKPIARWQFVAGKWLGISLLNAALLVASGAMIWGFTWYLKAQPTFEEDRKNVDHEVLTVRYGAKPTKPDFKVLADERMRQLREEGRLDEVNAQGLESIYKETLQNVQTGWRTLGPGQSRVFKFERLLVERTSGETLYLHFKSRHASGVDDLMMPILWQCGDPDDVNTLTDVKEGKFIINRFHSVEIPVKAVNADGDLYVQIQNMDRQRSYVFEGDDSFEVLYNIGTFHWNLFRAMSIIWCRLAFLAALGLLASSFLSFPVACMVGMMVLLTSSAAGFLGDAIRLAQPGPGVADPFSIFGPAIRNISLIFLWLVPDFSKFDPIGTVVAGRVVPLVWVIQSLSLIHI